MQIVLQETAKLPSDLPRRVPLVLALVGGGRVDGEPQTGYLSVRSPGEGKKLTLSIIVFAGSKPTWSKRFELLVGGKVRRSRPVQPSSSCTHSSRRRTTQLLPCPRNSCRGASRPDSGEGPSQLREAESSSDLGAGEPVGGHALVGQRSCPARRAPRFPSQHKGFHSPRVRGLGRGTARCRARFAGGRLRGRGWDPSPGLPWIM